MTPKPVLLLLLCILAGPEIALSGADFRFWGNPGWRLEAYQHGALWPGLFRGWEPTYPAQNWLMLISYAGLHSGFFHFLINSAALIALGRLTLKYINGLALLAIFATSAIGGALIHIAFTHNLQQPVVGASAGVFGLAAALAIWKISDSTKVFNWFMMVIGVAAMLYLLLYRFVPMPTWNIHIGGALAGAAMAVWVTRPRTT